MSIRINKKPSTAYYVDQRNLCNMELELGEYYAKKNFRPKKQIPPFQGMGRIYFILAEFFGPLGRTPFRGPGNTGFNQLLLFSYWSGVQCRSDAQVDNVVLAVNPVQSIQPLLPYMGSF